MRRIHSAFTLIELLTVIGVISILLAMLLPSLRTARESAYTVRCASQLHQIGVAMQAYLIENRQMTFWRGQNIGFDGMDWYVYGGRETGNSNLGQLGLFNRFIPRPLNKYLGRRIEVFQCPKDTEPAFWALPAVTTAFEWVGNSYNFNADGHPNGDGTVGGLAGVKYSSISDSSRRVLFYDASLVYRVNWHPRAKGNICMADGHVVFAELPPATGGEYVW
jgi:prepilin-type N-terminal cleavage/methylation domain-containing protein/prepilin-type processing-associated H-X9-DG protein